MIGREDQLEKLNQNYISDKSNLTILYGRHGVGKTTLIKEFIRDKKSFYYRAVPADDFEQCGMFGRAADAVADSYYEIMKTLRDKGIKLFVVEEFHNIIKNNNDFMADVSRLVKVEEKVMVILSCSSVAWVENSMVKTMGSYAFNINTFMKLKEFSYSDFISRFHNTEPQKLLYIYAITGGNPGYVEKWEENLSVKENICRLFLTDKGDWYKEALNYVKDEFREISVYNTILSCLAMGRNKLNDIHEYTRYGRDKISVYLKNLIAREIVEKIFSYDVFGNENTRKGLYRIQDSFIEFWYRFIYRDWNSIDVTEPDEFYEKYIEGQLEEFVKNAFIRIAGEMLEILGDMHKLPFEAVRKGSWYGKNGDIHLIFEDKDGNGIIGQVYVDNRKVSMEDFDRLQENVQLAGINGRFYYLFSINGFADDLKATNIATIGIEEL